MTGTKYIVRFFSSSSLFNLISGPILFLLVISLLNVNSEFQEPRPRCCPLSHSGI